MDDLRSDNEIGSVFLPTRDMLCDIPYCSFAHGLRVLRKQYGGLQGGTCFFCFLSIYPYPLGRGLPSLCLQLWRKDAIQGPWMPAKHWWR
jgi:hypothetical protein